MKPNALCGHTAYDRGHCGIPGCPNDYFACADCCPATQRRGSRDGWPDSRMKRAPGDAR